MVYNWRKKKMKKIIIVLFATLLSINYANAQCDGKTCKINGGEATVMVNELSVDQSNNTVEIRVSNDGPSANFKLKVILQVDKTFDRGIGSKSKELVVYFNEMAQGNSSSTFIKKITPNNESDWSVSRITIKSCEFQEGTICR